jgi:hypothetical protein
MCHQTVCLIAAELERRGIATTSVTMLPEITRKVGIPRALIVPYPLGYPLGRPDDPQIQTAVLSAALALLSHPGPPPVLSDFRPPGDGAEET